MKLRYTVPALADLDTILQQITANAPQGAKRVQKRIQAVFDLILLHPFMGVRTGDPVVRRMTTPPYPYVIFYEVAGGEIIIHAVRHAARDPSSMPGST